MPDRDINFNSVDAVHHIQGMSNLSDSVQRRKGKKEDSKKDHKQEMTNIDEKLEDELEIEEQHALTDEDMDHIDFRA